MVFEIPVPGLLLAVHYFSGGCLKRSLVHGTLLSAGCADSHDNSPSLLPVIKLGSSSHVGYCVLHDLAIPSRGGSLELSSVFFSQLQGSHHHGGDGHRFSRYFFHPAQVYIDLRHEIERERERERETERERDRARET